MEFTPEEIAAIYGKRIFLVPDEQPQKEDGAKETSIAEEKTAAAFEPNAATWLHKPTGRITCIAPAEDFADKRCIAVLKELTERAEIPAEHVSFGKATAAFSPKNLETMQTKAAALFGNWFAADAPEIPNGKQCGVSPPLLELLNNEEAKQDVADAMKALYAKI